MSQKSEFEGLLEEGATEALRKTIVPFVKGSLPSEKLDKMRLNVGVQLVSTHTKMIATKMHERALDLMIQRLKITKELPDQKEIGDMTNGRTR
jgi:hypothetical protein